MNRKRKITMSAVTVLLLLTIIASLFTSILSADSTTYYGDSPYISLNNSGASFDKSKYFDDSVVYRLPDSVSMTDELSLIIEMPGYTLLDYYEKADTDATFTNYVNSADAAAVKDRINGEMKQQLALLDEANVTYEVGAEYSTLLCGYEIVITARDYETVCKTLGSTSGIYIGDSYERADTQLVENTVNVYDTGIFNSSGFGYDGTGTVVAVLDTGLDYYHTAFSTGNFTADRSKLGLTFAEVSEIIANSNMSAERLMNGLTASDVYISEKVPFGFDYADNDSEVFPIRQDHGTHVAGIIAGKDDTITGVAPNAQLAIMKIFSDTEDTSKTSWIIAALEDCVNLGVDVINMSIGTSCGFSKPSDKELESRIYEKIDEMGMSLIVAASNSFSSAYGSDKNGNLGLTSNPDSATIGSPATYKGALSVASISGVPQAYLLYNGKIIYFVESTDKVSEEKDFVEELLGKDKTELEIEFVKIPGVGRSADYSGIDVSGKIVLIRRGSTTFEEKANVAERMGAAGVIIYNNVSGEIKMNVGETKIPVCSISQDAGEELAAAGSGKLKVSLSQTSGPFMSDFSSWGPGPDLEIKPEITAHGGSILSSVPGQDYDRISGTSMATPNISGVAALLRQYVVETFPAEMINDENGEVSLKKVTAIINRLMMSTADIVYNQNGLPYAVRKQGAGLANLFNCAATGTYLLTYDRETGDVMDKTKIELGDDPDKTGVYVLKFTIDNFGKKSVSYDLSAYVMTEGVSETLTTRGDTTVTETAYILNGATVEITSVNGGNLNGKNISVDAGKRADVTVTITLSAEDKKYLDESFENGMYVEGFVELKSTDPNGVSLSAPYLAFYGDWTKAPLFDLTYFDTNKDELDSSLDLEDKTLPDAYATRPIGGLYSDFVSYLGSFYYEQKPGSNMIAADEKYIALSNQDDAINSLRYVWGGLLRNAAKIDIVITDDATGEVVFNRTEHNVRKSFGDGGPIHPSNIEVEFSAIEHNLKNNTQYTVTLTGYLDYGDGGKDTNLNNQISFPLYTDFEAPAVTGCEFYTEYDRSTKKTRLFAKVSVYDNHYSMATLFGYTRVSPTDLDGNGVLDDAEIYTFDKYLTPVYSNFNSDSTVVYELTDYIEEIKNNSIFPNSITVCCFDYALNQSIYEVGLPDAFTDLYFEEDQITLSPNEVYELSPLVYPNTEWNQLLTYTSANPNVARIVGNEIVATGSGLTKIKADAYNDNGELVDSATVVVKVLAEGEEGYRQIDPPVVKEFHINGYYVNKAYYFISTDQRDIGKTGDTMKFVDDNLSLSMYPSESVTIQGNLIPYFDGTEIVFESSNSSIVDVTADGTITAKAEGFASISARVLQNGKSTYYSKTITVTVKDPYVTSGPTLTNYYGNGGRVDIPADLGITEIGQFAFSNFDYIDKGAGDIINDENPELTKIWYIGDDTIEEVVIPEGVETIGSYAFANLTKLKTVVLPSTLTKIECGAFTGCKSLTTVKGIENVKFVNKEAFYGCKLDGELKLTNAIAVADYAFAGNPNLDKVSFGKGTQSIGAFAFYNDSSITEITIEADFIKCGQFAFSGCTSLKSAAINAAVIPTGTFYGCTNLENVKIGKDVAVIGEYAFGNTSVSSFTVEEGNATFFPTENSKYLLDTTGTRILLVAPTVTELKINDTKITSIGNGAFSGNTVITKVEIPGVTEVCDYAFSECTALASVKLGKLNKIGDYAFFKTAISEFDFTGLSEIGAYSFGVTKLTSVVIPDGTHVGAFAFMECDNLETVKVGNNATIGDSAFAYNIYRDKADEKYDTLNDETIAWYVYKSPLRSLTIGNNVTLGDSAFLGASELTSVTLGDGAVIGDYAFYNAAMLTSIDLSKATSIGENAFYGDYYYIYYDQDLSDGAPDSSIVLDANKQPVYYYNSAKLAEIDLSSLTYLGAQAFAFNHELTKVTLGDKLTTIPYGAFYDCIKLSEINLSKIEVIEGYAFISTAITAVDLSAAKSIEEYAFLTVEGLRTVILGDAIYSIGEGAFSYCKKLDTVTGLEKVKEIGDYAFAYTALSSADLSSATHIGSHAFIKESMTDFDITLGEALVDIGDNPFAYCKIDKLNKTVVTDSFNGVDYTTTIYTFDISDTVKVIDGSIYKKVPNGLELITYCGNGGTVKIADNTVRISAFAFTGTDVTNVILPYTVKSIGHKAFYDCEKLALVSFSSYHAPILEEEYDFNLYLSGEHVPAQGDGGLGIVPYFMWNVTAMPNNVYYGASFIDYVGCVENKILMIRPSNGKNYDSFIFGQYFDTVIDGAAAADDTTLAAILAISRIPDSVTLSDEALIVAARAAYNLISLDEQKALVLDYQRLTKAEKRLADLKYLENEDNTTQPEPEPAPTPDTEPDGLSAGAIVAIVIGAVVGVAILAAGGYVLYRYVIKERLAKAKEKTETKAEAEVEAEAETEAEAEAEVCEEETEKSEETVNTESEEEQ